jgi:hypothetical protein
MPRETAAKRRRRMAINSGVTSSSYDFRAMCKARPERVAIVAEGDSWFAYPRKWIAFGADTNIIHHVAHKLHGTDTANLIRLASNGDEAVDMTSGKQRQALYNLLKKNRQYIKLILFSGGGNDIVGKRDLLPLLHEYQPGMAAMDCINRPRFDRRITEIMLAYMRLLDLCMDIVPQAKVITHTYDIPQPEDQGAEFFWGLIKTQPWIYPYLQRRGIPQALHLPIIEYMLSTLGKKLKALASESDYRQRFVVVDTQQTLRPGHGSDWLNEIHPSEAGFKRVAKKIYAAMVKAEPSLPRWS